MSRAEVTRGAFEVIAREERRGALLAQVCGRSRLDMPSALRALQVCDRHGRDLTTKTPRLSQAAAVSLLSAVLEVRWGTLRSQATKKPNTKFDTPTSIK